MISIIKKSHNIFIAIIFIGTSLPLLSLRKPLKNFKKQETEVTLLSNEELQDFRTVLKPIIEEIIEKKLKEQNSQITSSQLHQQQIHFSQEEQVVVNILKATLQLEQEVQSKNAKEKKNPTLTEAIENNYDQYRINSKGETLNWSSILTGELFSLIWHRWQYKMHNNISVTWQDMNEEYAVTIITESSSDNIGSPTHCDFTKKLKGTKNFEAFTPQLQAAMTGDCYDYGCEKQIAIRCKKAILKQLIQDQKNLKK